MSEKEENDLFYVCSLIEYIGRERKLRRADVVSGLGEETIRIETVSESTATSKENLALFHSTKTKNTARSNAETARALLKPDEVRRLPRETMLLFVQGVAPIACRRLAYYADPTFGGRFDANPYFHA